MSSVRVFATATFTLASLALAALAGPITVNVQAAIVAAPGQTPFTPDPGAVVTDTTFDLTPNVPVQVASFGPSDAWYAPSGLPHGTAVSVEHSFRFTYRLHFTDVESGQAAETFVDGLAFARWTERPDGTAVFGGTGVTLGEPSWSDFVLGNNRYFVDVQRLPFIPPPNPDDGPAELQQLADVIPSGGADVYLSAAPFVPETPEPATLALAACGLLPLAGMWLRKRKQAASA